MEEIVSTQLEQDFASIETCEKGFKDFYIYILYITHGKSKNLLEVLLNSMRRSFKWS